MSLITQNWETQRGEAVNRATNQSCQSIQNLPVARQGSNCNNPTGKKQINKQTNKNKSKWELRQDKQETGGNMEALVEEEQVNRVQVRPIRAEQTFTWNRKCEVRHTREGLQNPTVYKFISVTQEVEHSKLNIEKETMKHKVQTLKLNDNTLQTKPRYW